ncbi:AAA family ATPase [Flavobacterium filum]|uniref:AAA family ATPase n=1 Tax=Flavobacterium filum TaxID=370974 RepID=UPI0023F0877A|nr:AAA family ATPase [Flavobacterium filum]
MLIKEIKLNNFMCFSGENTFSFTEGLNIIIGDNGYGKSKLYDAFFWVLYDQVFDSTKKEFIYTKFVGQEIVSDNAKYEAVDDLVITSVEITFHNIKSNEIFILQRKLRTRKVETDWQAEKNTEFSIMRKEMPVMKARAVTDEDEKGRILRYILPENIKPYMWFQGEQVESIIDFNKHDTLTTAINVLSNISRFDNFSNIAKIAAKSARTEYDRELKKHSKDKNTSESLEKDKTNLQIRLTEYTTEEQIIRENLSRAETQSAELLNKIDDAQSAKKLEAENKILIEQLSDYKQQLLLEQINFNKKLFRNKWLLKGTNWLFQEYSKQFGTYSEDRLAKKTLLKQQQEVENEALKQLQTRLPINVPEPIYIERMLKEEKCLVCDRDAPMNSPPWLKIKELIDRPSVKLVESKKKHDFYNELNKLYHNGLALVHNIESIDDDIAETLKNRIYLESKIIETNTKVTEIERQINTILENASLSLNQSENILNEYNIQKDNESKYSTDLERIKNNIERIKSRISDIDKQLKDLVKGELPIALVEKVKILNDFEELAIITREKVFNGLIEMLENEANIHYQMMTTGNKAVRGIIKLIPLPNGNFMPQLKDDLGNNLRQLNTGNIILIKLAAIMAIISAKKGAKNNELYPLISDAPMSVFGEAYTLGFCKTVSHVYKQSIIMSKEFFKNEILRNELLNNSEIKLGNVYEISPSILEQQRENRNYLTTTIRKLN